MRNTDFLFLIISSFIFFLLRLPSLFEPYWYGDEGIYQAVAMAINNGSLLYKDIWDNKPPLLYLLYALFDSDQFAVRLVSLVFGLLSVIVFFFLTKKLFPIHEGGNKIHFLTTSIFALLLSLPILEGNIANAENFMLLPILIAALLVVKAGSLRSIPKVSLFFAGILLGLAFLFKVVAVFDFAAFFLFLLFYNLESISKRHSGLPPHPSLSLRERVRVRERFWMLSQASPGARRYLASPDPQNDEKEVLKQVLKRNLSPFFFGFCMPLTITALFFLLNNAFPDFAKAIFFSNVGYVGYGNKLLTPFGLLFIKLAFLLGFVVFLFIKRLHLKPTKIFVLLWFAFSLFNAFFAERPYTHYLLALLPSFVLMIGLIFWEKKYQKAITLFFILVFVLVLKNFNFYGKTITYYQNFVSFVAGQKTVSSYRAFFDKRTLTNYEVTTFIKSKIRGKDTIFIWGNNAQVYKMVGSIPVGKYIVAYHIIDSKDGLTNTKEAIEKVKPRFIIIMPDQKPIPFKLVHYSRRIGINNVEIYERFF